jgi:hypothetical protein
MAYPLIGHSPGVKAQIKRNGKPLSHEAGTKAKDVAGQKSSYRRQFLHCVVNSDNTHY